MSRSLCDAPISRSTNHGSRATRDRIHLPTDDELRDDLARERQRDEARTDEEPMSRAKPTDLEAALATMSAEALREVVDEALLELDERAHARVVGSIIARAARSASDWRPAAVGDEQVTEVLAFVKAAERDARADPAEVDEYLRRGQAAFLGKDYPSAQRILGALLPPLGNGDIDLGQDELVDEVLGTDVAETAAQYVVSAYMTAPAADRAGAVRAAIAAVSGLERFWEPLRQMERAAVEPLPGLQDFLPRWSALLTSKPAEERTSHWGTEEDAWRREVALRLDGAEGLAKLARATRRVGDLRAWCTSLVTAGSFPAALKAFEEAAELVTDRDYAHGDFLDGAALTAQRLGLDDLPARLERAWRAAPTMQRLRRWLGSSPSRTALAERIGEALGACPERAARQRALLHVLSQDFVAAAELLAVAPGIGWSSDEHPGHLLFPLFARLLGGRRAGTSLRPEPASHRGVDFEELEAMTTDPQHPHLATPTVGALLELAGVDRAPDAESGQRLLAAMKEAASSRVAGVTDQKRRRHYGHAAELVATCVACDESGDSACWAAALRADYRRFPALREALDRALAAS